MVKTNPSITDASLSWSIGEGVRPPQMQLICGNSRAILRDPSTPRVNCTTLAQFYPTTPFFCSPCRRFFDAGPINADVCGQIKAALRQYSVLIFPNQAIDDDEQIHFTRQFGPLEATKIGPKVGGRRSSYCATLMTKTAL
ncbi:MAG: hypothetical protein Ct9H300mP13_3920 [Gammaproteobacteria bacterium]|nr:MAG: hypothetical protein Ct9H300mP13_3920 [Gammaproteobacteria bacterium]